MYSKIVNTNKKEVDMHDKKLYFLLLFLDRTYHHFCCASICIVSYAINHKNYNNTNMLPITVLSIKDCLSEEKKKIKIQNIALYHNSTQSFKI